MHTYLVVTLCEQVTQSQGTKSGLNAKTSVTKATHGSGLSREWKVLARTLLPGILLATMQKQHDVCTLVIALSCLDVRNRVLAG